MSNRRPPSPRLSLLACLRHSSNRPCEFITFHNDFKTSPRCQAHKDPVLETKGRAALPSCSQEILTSKQETNNGWIFAGGTQGPGFFRMAQGVRIWACPSN